MRLKCGEIKANADHKIVNVDHENVNSAATQKPQLALTLDRSAQFRCRIGVMIMVDSTDKKLVWQTLDVESLSPKTRKLYDAYKAASKAAGSAREAFESSFGSDVPAPKDQVWRYGYRFGKFSIALDDTVAPVKKAAPVLTTATLMAMLQR